MTFKKDEEASNRLPPFVRQAIETILNPKANYNTRMNYRLSLEFIRAYIDSALAEVDSYEKAANAQRKQHR